MILQEWNAKLTFHKIKHFLGPSTLKIVSIYFHFLMESERQQVCS